MTIFHISTRLLFYGISLDSALHERNCRPYILKNESEILDFGFKLEDMDDVKNLYYSLSFTSAQM